MNVILCDSSNRAAELMYNERYPNQLQKSRIAFCRLKIDFSNMVVSDPKDVDRHRLLMKKNQQILLLM